MSIAPCPHHPTMRTKVILTFAAVTLTIPLAASSVILRRPSPPAAATLATHAPRTAKDMVEARLRADVAAMQAFRPAYPFWRHVFMIPDGSIAFGSAGDGRLLATFPARGNWSRQAVWTDPTIRPHSRPTITCAQTG